MLRRFENILQNYINDIDFSQDVVSFSELDGVTTIQISKLLHARDGQYVDIDGQQYTIAALVGSDSFTVESVIVDPKIVTLKTPTFLYGTPMAIQKKLKTMEWREKSPFIWLYHIVWEDIYRKGPIERKVQPILFFLDAADKLEDTEDHFDIVIDRMRNLAEFIYEYVEKDWKYFEDWNKYRQISHADFGKFVADQGHKSDLLGEKLSGVETRPEIDVLPPFACE